MSSTDLIKNLEVFKGVNQCSPLFAVQLSLYSQTMAIAACMYTVHATSLTSASTNLLVTAHAAFACNINWAVAGNKF